MEFYRLVIGVLVVWRLTHLLTYETGPFDVFARLRKISQGRFVGDVLDCFYCLSLWVSIPLAIAMGETLTARLLLLPALSAGAIFLERLIPDRSAAEAAYVEDAEPESK